MNLRLRHIAEVNPPVPEFDRLPAESDVTFMPLEAVWADERLDVTRVRPKREVAAGYVRFRDGDVIVPKVTPTFQAGRSAVVAGLRNGVGAGSTELHVLRSRSGHDARFIRYVVQSAGFLGEGASAFQGVAGLQRVPEEFVRDYPVAQIDLDGQRRIADFLDAQTYRIDQLAALQVLTRAALAERRTVAALHLVGGHDDLNQRTSDIPWLATLPSRWESGKINFFARMGSGHTPSRANPEWWIDCTVPWITTGEVAQIRDDRQEVLSETRECISYLGIANSSAELHPAGTVVLSRTASAGFSAVMARDMATSQDIVTWTCGPRLDPYYLLWCLRAMRPDLLGRLAVGSTHKTIYVPDLQALRIPLPPIDEQRQIVGRIRASNRQLDELVEKIDRQLELLVERRRALITAAVTGQLDVSTARGAA